MRPTTATALPALAALVVGCIGDEPDRLVDQVAGVAGQPALQLDDSFLPFGPGVFGYDRLGGHTEQHSVFTHFGLNAISPNTLNVSPGLDLPHRDEPDLKMRVRLAVSTVPVGWPSGDIVVHGKIYKRNWDDPSKAPSSQVVSEQLHFAGNSTKTTSTYFDEVTSIDTTGLGVSTTLTVEFWDGHEQEMNVGVSIANVADEATCESEWRVYFNGQVAVPDWDATNARCAAGMLAGLTTINGVAVPDAAHRGLYFGLVEGQDDAFFHFRNSAEDPTRASGHIAPPTTYAHWITTLSSGASFFDVEDDGIDNTALRPIVVELERQSDLQVVDAARMMLTIAQDASGSPGLVARLAGGENPGAIAQLSPRGLDRLVPTHASTLPYPIVPAGTQPRLSQSAIAAGEHTTDVVTVDLKDLGAEDLEYWTESNDGPEGEFAGYLAYKDTMAAAQSLWTVFQQLRDACDATTNPAGCKVLLRAESCVDHSPDKDDFRIRIDGVQTYFDPARTDDALSIGDVTGMDLAFGADPNRAQILADYTLADIQGWLQASIDPASVSVEWARGAFDPCAVLLPAPHRLSEYSPTNDRDDWFVCNDLSFAAASGSLSNPTPFDVDADGESIRTPYAPGAPTVLLAGVATDPGTGVCSESWMSPTITDALLDWQTEIEWRIAVELSTSPGEDETLARLLSPYELGVERVDAPPPGTPPYEVHPLSTYDLSATVAGTPAEPAGLTTDPVDGLYVPYLTRASPVDASPFPTWLCWINAGQTCNGLLGTHEPILTGGLDPDGDPYDVAINYTTAHISQALWAQARRPDRLGSPSFPARLALAPAAFTDQATALGFDDVVAALAQLGPSFGVRFHHEAAPYAMIHDGGGFDPPKLLYVIPNIVVELVKIAGDGSETVAAKFLVDVVDRDHHVTFSTGGVPELTASWGDLEVLSMTSTFLPGCYGAKSGVSCDDHLRVVLGTLWWPAVQGGLLDMIEQAPGLHLFDAGQESDDPRELKNVRTLLMSQGVVLVGDLCKPGNPGCP